VSVLLNQGRGAFATPVDYTVSGGVSDVGIADLDGDGKPDLAIANGAGYASVLLNQGSGLFGPAVDYAAGQTPVGIAVADLNGDGKPDLAVVVTGEVLNGVNGNVSVLYNEGKGAFAPPVHYPVGANSTAVVAADLNGDGKPDLAADDTGNPTGPGGSPVPGGVSVLLTACP
jgi:hypothetical protein